MKKRWIRARINLKHSIFLPAYMVFRGFGRIEDERKHSCAEVDADTYCFLRCLPRMLSDNHSGGTTYHSFFPGP